MYLIITAAVIIIFTAASFLILRINLAGAEAEDLSDPGKLAGTRLEKYARQLSSDAREFSLHPSEDLWADSPDGTRLHGSLMKGTGDNIVILAHGYRSSALNDFCGIGQWYLGHGFSILMPDQRAHGMSSGKYITFGVKERYDMLEWIRYARSICEGEIWLHGVSMGAASLLMVLPLTGDIRISGIVADSTFDNVIELLIYQMKRRYHVPPFLGRLLLAPAGRIMIGKEAKRLSPSECLRESGVRALVIHGGRDSTVPPGMQQRFADAGAVTALFPEARHALCWAEDPKGYASILREWMFGQKDI